MASSIISARSLPLSVQDGPNNTDDKVQRVRIEPERTGWARMYDLVREYDKNRIIDNKEDIDTLLVFVSPVLMSLVLKSNLNRLVYSRQLSLHLLSNHTRISSNSRKT